MQIHLKQLLFHLVSHQPIATSYDFENRQLMPHLGKIAFLIVMFDGNLQHFRRNIISKCHPMLSMQRWISKICFLRQPSKHKASLKPLDLVFLGFVKTKPPNNVPEMLSLSRYLQNIYKRFWKRLVAVFKKTLRDNI